MATRKASSTAVNSGVNSRVSTGAMFSTTLCLASTSQPVLVGGGVDDVAGADVLDVAAWVWRDPCLGDVGGCPTARECQARDRPWGVTSIGLAWREMPSVLWVVAVNVAVPGPALRARRPYRAYEGASA